MWAGLLLLLISPTFAFEFKYMDWSNETTLELGIDPALLSKITFDYKEWIEYPTNSQPILNEQSIWIKKGNPHVLPGNPTSYFDPMGGDPDEFCVARQVETTVWVGSWDPDDDLTPQIQTVTRYSPLDEPGFEFDDFCSCYWYSRRIRVREWQEEELHDFYPGPRPLQLAEPEPPLISGLDYSNGFRVMTPNPLLVPPLHFQVEKLKDSWDVRDTQVVTLPYFPDPSAGWQVDWVMMRASF